MIEAVAEDSFLIRFGDAIDPSLPARIARVCRQLESLSLPWLTDLIPAYTTLLVSYDPAQVDFRQVRAQLTDVVEDLADGEDASVGERHILPVYYSHETGPDLELIAEHSGLTVREVIALHCDRWYQVYALGFAPGFGFLGLVDERIALPRKKTPRKRVPSGSVAIADRQTAVYPVESPGGWQLIGRSPVTLFDPETLSLLKPGDQVRFNSITRERYLELGGDPE